MATKKQLIDEKKNARRSRDENDEKLVNASPENNVDDDEGANDDKQCTEPIRTRRFALSTYIDESLLQGFLSCLSWVQHWAFCTHDKDVKKNGEPKGKHTHVLLYTYQCKTASAIKKNFDRFSREYYLSRGLEPQNTCVQICHDAPAKWRYLRHLDDPQKYQYSETDVFTDNLSYWNTLSRSNGLNDSSTNFGLAILDDYINGTDCYTMAQRYGKEWIYHIAHYQNAVRLMTLEQNKKTFGGLADICQFALADSSYTEQQITLFFGMLGYIQNKMNEDRFVTETHRHLKA